MRLFIKHTILFGLILFIFLNLLIFTVQSSNEFMSGVKIKHNLLEKDDYKRLILIGGSGVGSSIDSRLIKQETGYHTINMGVWGQLGLRYILEEVKHDIKEGDIIVVIPEYAHYYHFVDGWRALNELIYVYPKSLTHLTSINQVKIIISTYPRFFRQKIKALPAYLIKKIRDMMLLSGDVLNNGERVQSEKSNSIDLQNGDYIADLDNPTSLNIVSEGLFPDIVNMEKVSFQYEAIDVLNNFYIYANTKGAKVYFGYPTIPNLQFEKYIKIINEVQNKFNANLKIPIINTPASETQPINDFTDYIYHLNRDGREKRTLRLIQQLRNVWEENSFLHGIDYEN